MAKDMKTRKGKDNLYYPYTSPDLVIDSAGESQTTKNNNMKTDIDGIKTDLGTEELTTTAKTVKGAVNEVAAQYKEIVSENTEIKTNINNKADKDTVRLKNTLITEYDISDELKQQITGKAPVSQTIGDETITPLKTTFMKRGINIFNKNDIVSGKYVDYGNGQLVDNSTYNASGYILIEPNTQYSLINILGVHYAFYDTNKTYIERTTNTEQLTFTTPSNARYFRCTIPQEKIDIAMIVKGSNTNLSYHEYEETLDEKYIKNSINQSKISFDVLDFTKSTNLFNKNSSGIRNGIYIENNWVNNNATYSTSDYIEVKEGFTYTISNFRFMCYYDANKTYISANNDFGSNKTFTIPMGVKYILFSALNTVFNGTMLNEGNTLLTYKEYKKVIPQDYLDIKDNSPIAFLPREIYVAVGRTIELYNNQVCINAERFNLAWKCDIGSAMKRKFTITGKSELIGEYDLVLDIYNDNLDLLKSLSTKLKVVNNVISKNVNILPIGDSLTNGKGWLTETNSLSEGKINYVGTRWNGFGTTEENATQKHEGRSGASAEWYIRNWPYDYEANGKTSSNPFWNPTTSKFDFGYYKTTYNINPDVVQIFLGTNGIKVDPTLNTSHIKSIVDGIRENSPSIKIYIVNTIYRSNQDGIGMKVNTDGYATFKNQYKREEDTKVFNLMKSLNETFSNYSNLYFINLALTHDTEYNFGRVETSVNPRSAIKEVVPYDSVHPVQEGYLQMADVMFSTFCGTLL